ncbi:hypothetical protein K4F52_000415 [Lecanicillium sp. MT-2017a]|nr:hypothetical protein K4F52_000415 [Lecanicillium sp. MT-2017a]
MDGATHQNARPALSELTDHGMTRVNSRHQSSDDPPRQSSHVEPYYHHIYEHEGKSAFGEPFLPSSRNIEIGYHRWWNNTGSNHGSNDVHTRRGGDAENILPSKRPLDDLLEEGEIPDQKPLTKRPRQLSLHTPRQFEHAGRYPLSGTEPQAVVATITYLESLLCSYSVPMGLLPDSSPDKRQTLTTFYTTGVGIVMAVDAKQCRDIPILPLPQVSALRSGTFVAQGAPLNGSLLEDIWHTLSSQTKYNYARQLRKIVHGLHSRSRKKKCKAKVGSPIIGEYSLVLDKHQRQTYWTIFKKPSMSDFAKFLAASVLSSVPTNVVSSVFHGLSTNHPSRFSHGELSPKNIIVFEGRIQYITGWDCAG